jgi:hypothetical protein
VVHDVLAQNTSTQTLEVLKSILSKYMQKLAVIPQVGQSGAYKQFLTKPPQGELSPEGSDGSDGSDMFIPVIKIQKCETQNNTVLFILEANDGFKNSTTQRSYLDFANLDNKVSAFGNMQRLC